MKISKKVFISYSNESTAKEVSDRICVDSIDWSEYENMRRTALSHIDIEVDVPDNILEIATEGLEQALQKMRAEHHQEEQELINRIADLRLLAAPKSVVLDDRDLTVKQQAKFNDGDAAEAEYNEIPW